MSFHSSVSCAETSNAELCRIRLLLECPAQLLPPTCPPICDMYCEHGNQVDEAGCAVCACNDPPSTTEVPVDTTARATAPVGFCTEHSNCDGPTYCNRIERCVPCSLCKYPPAPAGG